MPLQLRSTSAIELLIQRAGLTAEGAGAGSIDWKKVKQAAQVLRDRGEEVKLKELCKGSKLILETPVKRQVTPEFRKVLDECQRKADNAAYAKLVKDVSPVDEKDNENGDVLPTTKLQMGQGVHMAVTMGLGYALGSQFGGAIGSHIPLLKPLGGVVGVIFALILETVLFMARANMQTNAGMKYEHLWDPEGAKKKKQKPTPAGTPFTTQPKSKKVDTTGTDTKKDQ